MRSLSVMARVRLILQPAIPAAASTNASTTAAILLPLCFILCRLLSGL